MLHHVYPYSRYYYNIGLCHCTLLQDGWIPLHVASQEGHVQVAELLLQAGASVEQETKVRWGVGQDNVCRINQKSK